MKYVKWVLSAVAVCFFGKYSLDGYYTTQNSGSIDKYIFSSVFPNEDVMTTAIKAIKTH